MQLAPRSRRCVPWLVRPAGPGLSRSCWSRKSRRHAVLDLAPAAHWPVRQRRHSHRSPRLAAQGLLGTCPQVTADGRSAPDLAPASTAFSATSRRPRAVGGRADRRRDPRGAPPGRPRRPHGRMAVALQPATIATGKHAGQRGLEITLDGRRVGELTRLMAERYLPLVDEVAARGRRPAARRCCGRTTAGCRWSCGCRPSARPSVRDLIRPSWRRRPHRRRAAPAPGRDRAVTPSSVAAPPVGIDGRAAAWSGRSGGRRRSGARLGPRQFRPGRRGGRHGVRPSGGGDRRTATPTSTATATSTGGPDPTIEAVDEPVVVAAAPAPRRQTATARPTTTRPATGRPAPTRPPTAPAARSTLRRSQRIRPRARAALKTDGAQARGRAKTEAAPKPASSGCDPNYSGCVPIASDVDCEGGSGNGRRTSRVRCGSPATTSTASTTDNDGVGCE